VELRTQPVLDALRRPLALVEDDARRRQLDAYADSATIHVERAVHDLMSQLVQAVDERVGEHYRVRLAYRPGGLALEVEEKVRGGEEEERWTSLEGDVEKITIRIPAELKELATEAAARGGTSANTWFVKALARAIRNIEAQQEPPERERGRHRGGSGSRFTGWVGGDEE
jgi:hypothetical protein